MTRKNLIVALSLLAMMLGLASCNFLENDENQYSYQTLVTLTASSQSEGSTFLADGGITLRAPAYPMPDSIQPGSRLLLNFSVWDYNMDNKNSIWTVTLNAYRAIPTQAIYLLSDSTPDLAANQQLSSFEYCSLRGDLATVSCYSFLSSGNIDKLMLTYDNSQDSLGRDGNYYVNLELKHYAPSINVHQNQWQLNSYDLSPLKEAYAGLTDTLYINFTFTVEKATTRGLKYALR